MQVMLRESRAATSSIDAGAASCFSWAFLMDPRSEHAGHAATILNRELNQLSIEDGHPNGVMDRRLEAHVKRVRA